MPANSPGRNHGRCGIYDQKDIRADRMAHREDDSGIKTHHSSIFKPRKIIQTNKHPHKEAKQPYATKQPQPPNRIHSQKDAKAGGTVRGETAAGGAGAEGNMEMQCLRLPTDREGRDVRRGTERDTTQRRKKRKNRSATGEHPCPLCPSVGVSTHSIFPSAPAPPAAVSPRTVPPALAPFGPPPKNPWHY